MHLNNEGISRGKLEANPGFIPKFFVRGQEKTTPLCPEGRTFLLLLLPKPQHLRERLNFLNESFSTAFTFSTWKNTLGAKFPNFPRVSMVGMEPWEVGKSLLLWIGEHSNSQSWELSPWRELEMGFRRIPGRGDPGEVLKATMIPFGAPPASPSM